MFIRNVKKMKSEIPYREAKEIADKLVLLLKPHCERIEIAGSIRREKEIIGDIEIVCVPKQYDIGMFESGFAEIVNGWTKVRGELQYNKSRYTQRILPEGIKLDIFMPEPNDFFRQFAIRTGSADYSHKVIAGGWIKQGWCGSDKGLRKQSDCAKINDKWICTKEFAEQPPYWQSEEDFFEFIGVNWIEPKHRNI